MRVWFLITLVHQRQYIYDHTLRYITDLTATIDNVEHVK